MQTALQMPVGGPHRENWPALHVVILRVGLCVVRSGFRVVGAHARCRSETGAPAMPVGGPHRENWPALHVGLAWGVESLVRVSRSRAMPVGDRRSKAVRHPALEGFARGAAFSQQGWCGTHVGGGRRYWCGFRAHARCRSETGAPAMPVGGPHRENWPALHVGLAWGVGSFRLPRERVIGAGFALTRDAGRRPAPARDAGRRPPPGELASAPAMPVGELRSDSRSAVIFESPRKRGQPSW